MWDYAFKHACIDEAVQRFGNPANAKDDNCFYLNDTACNGTLRVLAGIVSAEARGRKDNKERINTGAIVSISAYELIKNKNGELYWYRKINLTAGELLLINKSNSFLEELATRTSICLEELKDYERIKKEKKFKTIKRNDRINRSEEFLEQIKNGTYIKPNASPDNYVT